MSEEVWFAATENKVLDYEGKSKPNFQENFVLLRFRRKKRNGHFFQRNVSASIERPIRTLEEGIKHMNIVIKELEV